MGRAGTGSSRVAPGHAQSRGATSFLGRQRRLGGGGGMPTPGAGRQRPKVGIFALALLGRIDLAPTLTLIEDALITRLDGRRRGMLACGTIIEGCKEKTRVHALRSAFRSLRPSGRPRAAGSRVFARAALGGAVSGLIVVERDEAALQRPDLGPSRDTQGGSVDGQDDGSGPAAVPDVPDRDAVDRAFGVIAWLVRRIAMTAYGSAASSAAMMRRKRETFLQVRMPRLLSSRFRNGCPARRLPTIQGPRSVSVIFFNVQ